MTFLFSQVNENYDAVKVSSYDDNILRWLQYYPLKQIMLIENKDLDHDPVPGKIPY